MYLTNSLLKIGNPPMMNRLWEKTVPSNVPANFHTKWKFALLLVHATARSSNRR